MKLYVLFVVFWGAIIVFCFTSLTYSSSKPFELTIHSLVFQLRPLRYEDFKNAMAVIRPSLQKSRWEELEHWNKEFGSN